MSFRIRGEAGVAFFVLFSLPERNRNVLQNHSRGWDGIFCALFCRNETGMSFRISKGSRNKPISHMQNRGLSERAGKTLNQLVRRNGHAIEME